MNKQFYVVGLFTGTNASAILATVMEENFVNCDFESQEFDGDTYVLKVANKYSGLIHPNTLKTMLSSAIANHFTIAITLRELRKSGSLVEGVLS